MNLLNIEQKKGDPEKLNGKLTVYARVASDTDTLLDGSGNQLSPMVTNGLLVAQGNYREHSSLKDFLIAELGISLDNENDLDSFVGKLDGIEGALDPEKLKEKFRNFDDMKDFIPTPASMVPFRSEDEILMEDGDIFYVGTYNSVANANLAVNSLPILYQARFREEELDNVQDEINLLINQIETDTSLIDTSSGMSDMGDVENVILKKFIPELLYTKRDKKLFERNIANFKGYLAGYRFQDDVDIVISIIRDSEQISSDHERLISLYARKIKYLTDENFEQADVVNKEIGTLSKKLGV